MANQTRIKIGGIMHARQLCLVGVMSTPDRPGLAARVFQALGQAHLNAQFIVQSIDLQQHSHFQFCVDMHDMPKVTALLEPIAQELGTERIITQQPVALLAVFGPDFRERPGIAGTAFGALAAEHINILAVSTSISTISCIIDDAHFDAALTSLRTAFDVP